MIVPRSECVQVDTAIFALGWPIIVDDNGVVYSRTSPKKAFEAAWQHWITLCRGVSMLCSITYFLVLATYGRSSTRLSNTRNIVHNRHKSASCVYILTAVWRANTTRETELLSITCSRCISAKTVSSTLTTSNLWSSHRCCHPCKSCRWERVPLKLGSYALFAAWRQLA